MSSERLTAGTRLGKYKVLAHIATGGMGTVYKASDEQLGRIVALKVLDESLAEKPNTLERFRREARHAARLTHKNIVTLYEYGQAEGRHFLVLEFIDGIDLYDYIERKGRSTPEESRRILVQAVQALDHAYKQGITHRDIKPSNFLLTRDRDRMRVKLTDMGLAQGRRGRFPRHARRQHGRHHRLSGPGTSARQRRRRHPQRHLFTGLHPLSHADRQPAFLGRRLG